MEDYQQVGPEIEVQSCQSSAPVGVVSRHISQLQVATGRPASKDLHQDMQKSNEVVKLILSRSLREILTVCICHSEELSWAL